MTTQDKFVITLSREVGSGGRTVGRLLAEKLNVRYCDKELIRSLSERFGLSASAIERIKGEKKNWLRDLFSKYYSAPVEPDISFKLDRRYLDYVETDDVYKAEKEIILSLAEEESCVIAGRSAFFILKDHPDKLDVFIHASKENRVGRVMRKQGLSEAEAAAVIDEVDSARENFVKRYSGGSRYDLRNYDLVLNMDNLSEEKAVSIILDYIGK